MPFPKRALPFLEFFEASGQKYGLDPALLYSIADHESLCGQTLTPPGPAGTGDHEHGLGIMQIDARFHPLFAVRVMPDGKPAWQDAATNIDYGASILKENLQAFNGCEAAAVAAYNAGRHRVAEAIRDITRVNGKPPPIEAVIWAVDQVCAGGDYCSDILRRRELAKLPKLPPGPPPPKKPV